MHHYPYWILFGTIGVTVVIALAMTVAGLLAHRRKAQRPRGPARRASRPGNDIWEVATTKRRDQL